MILVIHHLVELTLDAIMEFVHVILNIVEIHIKVVDQNVFSVPNVLQTRLVLETNVLIHVPARAVKMLFVM